MSCWTHSGGKTTVKPSFLCTSPILLSPDSPGIDEIIRRHKSICLNIDSGNDQISEYYSNMIKNHLEAWYKFVPTVDTMGPKNCWCTNNYRVPSSRVQRLLSHWVNLDSVSTDYSILQAQSIVRSVQNEEHHKTSFSSFGVRKCFGHFCLPEVYLIGFPTCGTTALYSYLTMNASAAIPWVKEGQFWRGFAHVKEGQENNVYLQLDVLHYIHLYKKIAQKTNSKTRLIDASATTSYDFAEFGLDPTKDTCFIPALLSRVLPNVKIIVIMREPVSRLWSQYWSYCSQRWSRSENDQIQVPNEFAKAPAEAFHNHSLSVVKKFLECSRQNSEFDCLKFTRGEACTQPRLSISLYYLHIAKWLSVFPREQFYFLRIEDMKRELYSEMKGIWTFLNTNVLSEEDFMSALEHNKLDQNANMWIKSEQYKDSFQMWPETKQLLRSFFQPYNERLARLLDDNKYLWHDV